MLIHLNEWEFSLQKIPKDYIFRGISKHLVSFLFVTRALWVRGKKRTANPNMNGQSTDKCRFQSAHKVSY